MKNPALHALTLAVTLAAASSAQAHVSLESSIAEAGAPVRAVLRVGHGCEGSSTTGLSVRIPPGFDAVRAEPKPGWTVTAKADAVTWTASAKESALPDSQRGEFVLTATAPRAAAPYWLQVQQKCERGAVAWADIPAQGTATTGMKTPAALLQVLSPREFAQAKALPRVEGAWVRSSVPGQQGTGAFMRITATQPMQLVGVSTPVAGVAEVHEMKMEGDVMLMRPAGKLDLPAGQTIELKPGGYHLMLMDLKQALAKDSVVPLTLVFKDAKGAESRMELKVPVSVLPPGGAAAQGAASAPSHKH